MKKAFKFPMLKSERVWGCVYIPIHALLPLLVVLALSAMGFDFSEVYVTLIYYTLSFVFVLIIAHNFLRKSFSDMLDGFVRTLQSVILGYALFYVLTLILSLALEQVIGERLNPITSDILELARKNRGIMIVVIVVLAPIIEETLFRGALFGSLRQKSRVLAYIISTLLFAVFYLWHPALKAFDPMLLLFSLQYIAMSIALAWCYEHSGTIWAPILLHAVINYLSIRSV